MSEEKITNKDELVSRVTCQVKESETNLTSIQVDINMVMISEVIDKDYRTIIKCKRRLVT